MGKKGVKADYVKIGSATNPTELQESVNGHILGISKNKHNNNYYTMIPKALLLKDAKRSKCKWLGSDLEIAIARFNALIAQLKGKKETFINTTIKTTFNPWGYGPAIDDSGNYIYSELTQPAKEQQYIEWLKRELQNPIELAKKTGIPELAELGTILSKDTNIQLKELMQNYLAKKKKISKKEEIDSGKWFNTFCKVIDCKTVDAITLSSIHAYENYIYSQGLAPKSIKHRLNKISTIFNYNTGRFNSVHLVQVHNWLKGLDRPEEDKPFDPSLLSKKDFNKLFEVSNIKWKAMLLLGLNCAMYPIDLSRLQKSNINFKDSTIAFRRGKTGKVLAVSTLWERTTKVLKEYLATRTDNSEYVFITQFGKGYRASGITNSFNQTIRKKAQVNEDVKFCHLRDTFSTLAQDLGFSIEQINLVLGHINKGMQDRYAVRQANKLTGRMCMAVEKEFFNNNL